MSQYTRAEIDNIKQQFADDTEKVASLLMELGSPECCTSGDQLVFRTICHGGDSMKLYYYPDSNMFHCYTSCGSFDVIELVCKVKHCSFSEAMEYLYSFLGINPRVGIGIQRIEEEIPKEPVKEFNIDDFELPTVDAIDEEEAGRVLRYYDPNAFHQSWINEGISEDTMRRFEIEFEWLDAQIIIPCRDIDGRLLGVRNAEEWMGFMTVNFSVYSFLVSYNDGNSQTMELSLTNPNDKNNKEKELCQRLIELSEKNNETVANNSHEDVLGDLQKLKDLHDTGIVPDDIFEIKKKELLAKLNTNSSASEELEPLEDNSTIKINKQVDKCQVSQPMAEDLSESESFVSKDGPINVVIKRASPRSKMEMARTEVLIDDCHRKELNTDNDVSIHLPIGAHTIRFFRGAVYSKNISFTASETITTFVISPKTFAIDVKIK